jgi:hypothetical protein
MLQSYIHRGGCALVFLACPPPPPLLLFALNLPWRLAATADALWGMIISKLLLLLPQARAALADYYY